MYPMEIEGSVPPRGSSLYYSGNYATKSLPYLLLVRLLTRMWNIVKSNDLFLVFGAKIWKEE